MVREWLLTVTGAACVSSIAMAVTPEGTVKKAVRLSCGLLMMAALLSVAVDIDDFSEPFGFSERRESARSEIDGILSSYDETRKESIEENAAAYILEKAGAMGLNVTVSVTAGADGSGCYLPVSAAIAGEIPEDAREELSEIIETELGITRDNQKWGADDG